MFRKKMFKKEWHIDVALERESGDLGSQNMGRNLNGENATSIKMNRILTPSSTYGRHLFMQGRGSNNQYLHNPRVPMHNILPGKSFDLIEWFSES